MPAKFLFLFPVALILLGNVPFPSVPTFAEVPEIPEGYDPGGLESLLAETDPVLKERQLEAYVAVLVRLLEAARKNGTSRQADVLLFNLALAHFHREELGMALYRLEGIRGGGETWAMARSLAERIANKTSFEPETEEGVVPFLIVLVSFNYLDEKTKLLLVFLFNFLFCSTLFGYAKKKRRSFLAWACCGFLLAAYVSTTLFFPHRFGIGGKAYVVDRIPEIYRGAGEFFPRSELLLGDGAEIGVETVKGDWVSFRRKGELHWIRREQVVFLSEGKAIGL